MKVGLYMNTHGIGATINGQWTLQPLPAAEMDVASTAQHAEAAGFESLWFSDHVLMAPSPASAHNAADPVTGARAYPQSPDMLDAIVSMAVAATVTSRVRLAPSVWIAPYRHPLHDVRQLTSIDQVSNGRLIAAVGVGWMREEFAALDVPFDERLSRLEESVEVYKRAWTHEQVTFDGSHYSFGDVRMDPKPIQTGRPPIYYGGVTPAALRLAARCCDGWYPTFTDPQARPDRYSALLGQLPALLEAQGRACEDFALLAVVSGRIDTTSTTASGMAKGPPQQVVDDLEQLAGQGFSTVVFHLDTLDGSHDEWRRQLDLIGEHVIPHVAAIKADGRWADA